MNGGSNSGGSNQSAQSNNQGDTQANQFNDSLNQLMSMSGANGQKNPINSGLQGITGLSQILGYSPGSMFGYNLGQQPGQTANAGNLMYSLFGGKDNSQQQPDQSGSGLSQLQTGTGAGQGQNGEQSNYWSNLWNSIFSGSSNQ